MKTKELLLWFAVIITLALTIQNMISIRAIMNIMETMIETDKAIIYWMGIKNVMTMI